MIDDGLDGDFVTGYDGSSNPSKVFTTVEGLTERTIYRMKVAAINKSGVGAYSDEVTCFTVTIPGQPGKPELVTSTATSISVEWGAAYDDGGSPIKEYEVEIDEVEGIGQANTELWVNVFTGEALSYEVTTGLTATS